MTKILPLADSIVNTYPGYAATLAIGLPHEQVQNWFVETYLNLYTVYDLRSNFFFF